MLGDYGSLPPHQRNVLRIVFLDPRSRALQYDWESVARHIVGAFRVEAARAGAAAEVEPLVDELCRLSPEFRAMWRNNDVREARSPLNIRPSRSTAGRISACVSTIRRLQRIRRRSHR